MADKSKDGPQSLGPTSTRLRQIALVAKDLEKARHLLVRQLISILQTSRLITKQTTVIGREVIYEDPAVEQWGLKNILGKFAAPPSPSS